MAFMPCDAKQLIDIVKERFPSEVLHTHAEHAEATVVVKKEAICDILAFLQQDTRTALNMLMDLTCVDWQDADKTPRFEMVYHLYSHEQKHCLRIKAGVDETDPEIPSVTSLWKIADWLEREVWDMFGVRFIGHPNLKRILMYPEFEGHPLRKDYALDKRQPLLAPRAEKSS